MYKVGDIAFDEYYVKSVELELDTCDLIIKVIFHKDKIEREKHYKIETDCNVDINELIDNLSEILKNE
jgi:galactitol-specific phosphotransferase system IIB component